MSIQFSDTTNYKGIVQLYEKECGMNQGDISGNTTKLKEFTAQANLALDDFMRIALKASGKWQFDDSNQSGDPILTTNLVSGQRDYHFTSDTDGNLILDIYRVFVANSSGVFMEVYPVDSQGDNITRVSGFTDGRNVTGVPFTYDKTANAIFLDPIPNYSYTGGLKMYVNREGSYFTSTDTTKKPGVPGLFHRYFYLKPALEYARQNGADNYQALLNEVIKLEGDEDRGLVGEIQRYFSKRAKDDRAIMTGKKINYI